MIQLKEVIQHYIGQRCIAITYDGIQHNRLLNYSLIGELAHTGNFSYHIKEIKPILRKLEDMTEEEMKTIWQIIFGRPFHQNGRILWFDKESSSLSKRWVLMSGVERLGIELSGHVWADSDLSHYKFNPAAIFHYLLKQGFDLFELIESGQAIDQKTLNPHP